MFDDQNSFRRTQLSQTSTFSRSLVRLMKSSEFGLGHLIRDLKRSLIIYLTPLHATPELALRPEFEKPLLSVISHRKVPGLVVLVLFLFFLPERQ